MIKLSLSLTAILLCTGPIASPGDSTRGDRGSENSAEPVSFAVTPALRFTSPSTASIYWESSLPGTGAVAYGETPKLGNLASSSNKGLTHTAMLDGLAAGTTYYYKIGMVCAEKRHLSPLYEFSTDLNFSVPAAPEHGGTAEASERAQAILAETGVTKGYCLLLESEDSDLMIALAHASELILVAVLTDAGKVQRLRENLYAKAAYGTRVSVLQVDALDSIPLTPCFANLLIVSSANLSIPTDKLTDILVPGHGKACYLLDGRPFKVHGRHPLPGIGEWSHQYGDTANTASSGEKLGGARATDDLKVQWVGRPGGNFGIDRQPRMPAPIAANGRLFHQGMNRFAAMDAYNGTILWSMEIPDLRRVNIPRDCSNWCVDAEHLYLAVNDLAWIYDAGTGERMRTLALPPEDAANHHWGFIARAGRMLFGSSVHGDAIYTGYWGGDSWFDGKGGSEGTGKVCSDSLFAHHIETGRRAWTYRKGLILNPTISIGGGRVYFVETRNESLRSRPERQILSTALWEDQFLVALDAESGELVFEQPIDTEDGTATFYLQYTDQGLILTASNTQYHLYSFHPESGRLQWQNSKPWPDDHHSGHIQHPVIVNETIYLQPHGYSLRTGEVVTSNVGERSGCHTYVGAENCLIYRGQDRQIALWDQQGETVTSWSRLRPSCWLSVVPSNGLLLVPEGGGGCSCGGWMETSLVFAPKTLLGYPSPTND